VTAPLIPERVTQGPLTYERVAPEHAADLARLMAEPLVLKTLWPWPEPPSETELNTRLQGFIDHWDRHGFGLWIMRDAATDEFVGRGGLEFNHIDGRPTVEVAWAVMPARWGEGLATELARLSVRTAFERLELRELVAIALPGNIASRRVMEKSGFRYDRDIVHVGLDHVLYLQRAPTDQGRLRTTQAPSADPLRTTQAPAPSDLGRKANYMDAF
jgi:RimJ/RimL family protein N-acetyltransferase